MKWSDTVAFIMMLMAFILCEVSNHITDKEVDKLKESVAALERRVFTHGEY
jgi:uncharacterized membrane protein (DUF485 family)